MDIGKSLYFFSKAKTGTICSARLKEVDRTLRSNNAKIEATPLCHPLRRKHASETTASQVKRGGLIEDN